MKEKIKFLEILKELEKNKNEKFIVLIICGTFFVAIEEDTILLSK